MRDEIKAVLRLDPEKIIDLLQKLIDIHLRISIDDWLATAYYAIDKTHQAYHELQDPSLALQWGRIADYVLQYMVEQYGSSKVLNDRIMNRIWLMRHLGVNKTERLLNPIEVITWLDEVLAIYQRDEVERLASTWQTHPKSTQLSDDLLHLRELRIWITCIYRLNEIQDVEMGDDLLGWLDFRTRLP